ncbi:MULTISPECIES: diguanylate cyclase domain-containing protein [unclassified Fusibacter]|uniref:sensor domain-containing diguanylate cyclase n=1 Tax=unclassified Fusibacter TaxID=2624464 RepID=UPI0013E96379|nr:MULTISPECIES: diguanylate cyclase [unclassified Fusibacter]MCK8060448.1 diguanylate cyclase [Fusibacter sp. A2]NPE20263.1 diguanylate cyclase [Fusibacter sp. A1]
MKIKTKVFYFFILFFVASFSIMLFIGSTTAMKGYDILEEERLNWEIKRIESGISHLVRMHESILLDWAKWDDAYAFIEQPNEEFITSNFSRGLFIDQTINYAIIYDDNGRVLFKQGHDYLNNEPIDVPKQLIDDAFLYPETSGFFKIGDMTLVYTSMKLTDTQETAPEKGLIVFATIVNQPLIKSLSESLLIDLNWEYPVVQYSEVPPIQVMRQNDHTDLNVHVEYVNFLGNISIITEIPHDITSLGKETLMDTLIMFTTVFLVLTIVMYYGVHDGVARISELSGEVLVIHNRQDLHLRVTSKGKDDIGILADNINDMLDQLEEKNNQILEYATYDVLTGVLTRRIGFERLEMAMEAAKKNKTDLVICFIDINNLKEVNDTLGHNAGDQYLKIVSDSLMNNTRSTDIVCRLGGDEFLVVFHHCPERKAYETLSRIEKEIESISETENAPYKMSISKGVVSYVSDMSLTSFVEQADKKMYEDKKRNKSLVDSE